MYDQPNAIGPLSPDTGNGGMTGGRKPGGGVKPDGIGTAPARQATSCPQYNCWVTPLAFPALISITRGTPAGGNAL